MKETVNLILNNELEISVKGIYTKGERDILYLSNGDPGYQGTPEEFLIEKIHIEQGNILNLIDWCNDQLNQQISIYKKSNFYTDIYVILEELCLYKLKNE